MGSPSFWPREVLALTVLALAPACCSAPAQEQAANERSLLPLWGPVASGTSMSKLKSPLPNTMITPSVDDQDAGYMGVVAVGDDQEWKCSGVVVADHLVLTAKHCRGATRVSAEVDVKKLLPDVIRVVGSPIEHPSADVALLRLEADGANVPAYLMADGCRLGPPAPIPVELVGYGFRSPSGTGGAGRRAWGTASLERLSCAGAQGPPAGDWTPCVDGREFALGASYSQADTCKGDSGGPVLMKHQGRLILVGVTSRGIDSGSGCGHGGIYTRSDAVATWARAWGVKTVKCPF